MTKLHPIIGPGRRGWLAGNIRPRAAQDPKLDFPSRGRLTDPPQQRGDVAYGASTGMQLGSRFQCRYLRAAGWTQGQALRLGPLLVQPAHKLQFGSGIRKSANIHSNGGTLADANVRVEFWPAIKFQPVRSVQYELWNFQSSRPPDSQCELCSAKYPSGPKDCAEELGTMISQKTDPELRFAPGWLTCMEN